MDKIKFVDLKAQYLSIKDDIDNAIKNVIDNTAFIMGENVNGFEKEFAEFCNARHCVGVSSGTSALFLALKAAGLKRGSEVITIPNTFIATTEVAALCGAKVKFVDIDPKTYTIDTSKLREAVTKKTKVILPVHLFGMPCDMEPILETAKEKGIMVIEDCAQAHGAEYKGKKVGSFGDIGCFSFFPAKNLGAYGDAGGIVTNDSNIAAKIGALRNHGRMQAEKYKSDFEGTNERLDALQAAILRVKLKHLNRWNELRRKHAKMYNDLLSGINVEIPFEPDYAKHVYHIYAIKSTRRDEIKEHLAKNNIECGIHYPLPLHLQPAYKHLKIGEGSFVHTEKAAKEMLSLPMFPELTEEQIHYVVDNIKEITNH